MSTSGLIAVAHTMTPFYAVLDGSVRRHKKASATNPGSTSNGAAWSHNGLYLAIAHAFVPRLRVYSAADWTLQAGTPSLGGEARSVDFSPNNNFLAVAYSSSPNLAILNTADWTTVAGTPTIPGIAYSCRFNAAGTLLAVGHANSTAQTLTVINTSDWSVAQSLTLSNAGLGVSWSPDGSMLAASHNDGKRLTVFNTADWTVISATPDLAAIGTAHSCSFSPDGTTLAIAHGSGSRLTVLNVADWSVVTGTINPGGLGYSVDYAPDNRLAIAFDAFPWIMVLDKLGQNVLWEPGYLAGSPRGVRWSQMPLAGSLSGTVLNELEAPVQREVFAVRDSTKDVVATGLSDATTGAFSLSVPTSDGHTVLMKETAGRVKSLGGGVLPI